LFVFSLIIRNIWFYHYNSRIWFQIPSSTTFIGQLSHLHFEKIVKWFGKRWRSDISGLKHRIWCVISQNLNLFATKISCKIKYRWSFECEKTYVKNSSNGHSEESPDDGKHRHVCLVQYSQVIKSPEVNLSLQCFSQFKWNHKIVLCIHVKEINFLHPLNTNKLLKAFSFDQLYFLFFKYKDLKCLDKNRKERQKPSGYLKRCGRRGTIRENYLKNLEN
jgi:hypothetical protein